MMMKRTAFKSLMIAGSLSAAMMTLGACGQLIQPSEPTTFFRLVQNPAMTREIVAPRLMNSDIQIGVGPVQIPGYADRPQIVTAGPGGQLVVDDLHHWAEPLPDNIERILVSDMGAMLNTSRVYPFPTSFHPDQDSLQIAVEIRDIIREENGNVRLVASWNVKRLLDNRLLTRGNASYNSQESADTYGDYASKISQMLRQLSKDILRSVDEKI